VTPSPEYPKPCSPPPTYAEALDRCREMAAFLSWHWGVPYLVLRTPDSSYPSGWDVQITQQRRYNPSDPEWVAYTPVEVVTPDGKAVPYKDNVT
jgi:hypothetical protein